LLAPVLALPLKKHGDIREPGNPFISKIANPKDRHQGANENVNELRCAA